MCPAPHHPRSSQHHDAPRPDDVAPSRDDLITQWIGQQLMGAAPPEWRRLDLQVAMAANITDIRFTVIMKDGSTPGTELPDGINFALNDLRKEMYEEGKGTWFSLRLTIDPPGDYHANFNFDLEPIWEPPVPDAVLVEDLQAFPRTAEHVPTWLRAKIDEHANEAEHQAER